MARIISSGFESGALATEPLWLSTTGAPTVQSGVVHSGSNAMAVSGSVAAFTRYSLPAAVATGKVVYKRVYFYMTQNPTQSPSILEFEIGGSVFGALIDVDTSGRLILRDTAGAVGSVSSAMAINTWHYVELAASSNTGAGASYIEGRLNGVSFATSSTANTGASAINNIRVGSLSARILGGTFYFDDIALNDNQSITNGSWPGATGGAVTATARAELGVATGAAPWFYGLTDVNNDYYLVDREQAKWVKHDCFWQLCEPTTKGTYVWTQMDMIFDAANSRGINQIITLHGVPVWASATGIVNQPPTNPQDFADFCTAAVNRYKNRGTGTKIWELWNEPNIFYFWNGIQPTAAIYTPVLKAGYTAIKAADPTSTVLGGCLLALDTNTTGHLSPTDMLNGMYALGAKGYFDALSTHPYVEPRVDPNDGGALPPQNNGFNDFANMRTILAANGDGDMPIWITEYGNETVPAANPTGITQAQQATYTASAFSLARAETNVSVVIVYSHRNDADSSANPPDNFGIANADRTLKTAAATFQAQVAIVATPVINTVPVASGSLAVGQTVTSQRGLWTNLPASWTYQWQDSANGTTGWANIGGATSKSYSTPLGELGKYLRCNVVATNEAGSASASPSNVLGPIVQSVKGYGRSSDAAGFGGKASDA